MVWQIDLSGKCIVVTGGNRGIGWAISQQCAQAGAHVAIIYHSSPDAPDKAKEIAEKYKVRCEAYKVDVGDQEAIQELMGKIYKDVGPIGGVVCNAGIAVVKPALEMTKADYDKQMNANLWGTFVPAQACAKLWKEHGYQNGKVVFVSSMSSLIANKGQNQCFYNSSKGAVTNLAKTLAMEWADQGIIVNCLSPGITDTDQNQKFRDDADLKKETEQMIMLKRIGTADEQAGTAVFFLSDYASFITGTQLIVDGGQSSW